MLSTTTACASHHRWQDLPAERLKGTISRRYVSGERLTIAHFSLRQGDDVPRHAHENEQISHVLEGALRLWLGADGEHELTARAGEFIVIPAGLPHRALALEDTLVIDVFSPPRRDWLSRADAYLRG